MCDQDQEAGRTLPQRADGPSAARLRTHSSAAIAKALEYQLLGDLTAEFLLRGLVLEVLRSDVDAFGHDVVLEVGGLVRHVQLKTMVKGGKNDKVTCHMALAGKPSGCIVWITYDPETYRAVEYACFGEAPGQALQNLGNSVALRNTPNGQGERPPRSQHREIAYSKFLKLKTIDELVDWLFREAALASREPASGGVN